MVSTCRTCHRPFCSRCLVFAFGPNKPPYCIGCALNASGVRNGMKTVVAAAAPVDKAAERAERRAAKAEAKAQARALKRAAKKGDQVGDEGGAGSDTVPAPAMLTTPASRYVPSNATDHIVT